VHPNLLAVEISHNHVLLPKPEGWGTVEWTAAEAQALADEIYNRDKPPPPGAVAGAWAVMTDPIEIVKPASHTYQCHTWTFRPEDTVLADLNQRYLLFGESVPTLLEQEGYADVTDIPSRWKVGDVVVFAKAPMTGSPSSAWAVTHTGRLVQTAGSLDDPALRYHSKWSMAHPEVVTSVRDTRRMPHLSHCKIFANPVNVPVVVE
jgi:hypothetical protein